MLELNLGYFIELKKWIMNVQNSLKRETLQWKLREPSCYIHCSRVCIRWPDGIVQSSPKEISMGTQHECNDYHLD